MCDELECGSSSMLLKAHHKEKLPGIDAGQLHLRHRNQRLLRLDSNQQPSG
jgi:hypothetical protein